MKKTNIKRTKSKIKSNKVGKMLKKLEMTQTELAHKCKTNVSHISRIVNGLTPVISLPLALKIAKVLGEPVEKIFTLEK